MFFQRAFKSCCITGQDEIPDKKHIFLEQRIKEEVGIAIADGFTRFITRLDNECDLLFTNAVLEARGDNKDIWLEAFFPFRGSIEKKEREYKELLGKFKFLGVISEEYGEDCYIKADKQMLENSERIIIVYNEEKIREMHSALSYANMHGIEVITIKI